MNLDIRTIKPTDYKKAHAFQCEYLDTEDFRDFVHRVEANPDLYFVASDGDELVGVCYGHPPKKGQSTINLQGIAVNLDVTKRYARVGIGSNMMQVFEGAVKRKGYSKIGVGAADDPKVEHFYLKNGFKPCELVAKSGYEELARVQIDNFTDGKILQQALRQKYDALEVIFIFEKSVV